MWDVWLRVLVVYVCACVCVWVCVGVRVGDRCGCVGGYWGWERDASVCVGVVGVEGGRWRVGDTTHDA